ncbi:MAG: hypothetical protein LBB79_08060 [Prevotellaceae bacterium]|nr:hypothetical protein [Prevotellaceae bacterium]
MDDFDTDNGFSGKVQFALAVRDPETGDKSASNGFESDNDADGSTDAPRTSAVFANVSLFGPVVNPASYANTADVHGSPTGGARFQAGLHLRRNTQLSIFNSLVAAFPIGLIIENDKGSATQSGATSGNLNVASCVIAGTVKPFQDKQYWTDNTVYSDGDTSFTPGYFRKTELGNRLFAAISDLQLSATPSLAAPVAVPQSGSPLATGAAWTNAKVASGFDKVAYIGAFGPSETANDNWATGWTNFDPQNTDY